MILITLEPRAVGCRVELDGKDITTRLRRIELDADVNATVTLVRLTLIDEVIVMGTPGMLELVPKPKD
jgi:hypothetical protein